MIITTVNTSAYCPLALMREWMILTHVGSNSICRPSRVAVISAEVVGEKGSKLCNEV